MNHSNTSNPFNHGAKIKPGVATGEKALKEIFKLAKEKSFALPAVNVIGTNSVNTVLETAKIKCSCYHSIF